MNLNVIDMAEGQTLTFSLEDQEVKLMPMCHEFHGV